MYYESDKSMEEGVVTGTEGGEWEMELRQRAVEHRFYVDDDGSTVCLQSVRGCVRVWVVVTHRLENQ